MRKNRKIKDSLFTNLFGRKEYAVQLVKALHPEETDLTEDDIESITLPCPEIYVIFTGERKSKPEFLRLSDHFESNKDPAVELKVKMIYNSSEGDIIYQYINFCRVLDSEHRLNPDDDRTAVRNTFRICSDKNLLKKYLEEHEVELNDIMYDYLFNEKYWRKLAIRDETERLKKEARETGYAEGLEAGIAEGHAAGHAEGIAEGINAAKKETAVNMIKLKVCTLEQISKITEVPLEEIRELAVELEKS